MGNFCFFSQLLLALCQFLFQGIQFLRIQDSGNFVRGKSAVFDTKVYFQQMQRDAVNCADECLNCGQGIVCLPDKFVRQILFCLNQGQILSECLQTDFCMFGLYFCKFHRICLCPGIECRFLFGNVRQFCIPAGMGKQDLTFCQRTQPGSVFFRCLIENCHNLLQQFVIAQTFQFRGFDDLFFRCFRFCA